MLFLTLLVLSIAPGIFILWYVYNKDQYEKEPKSLVIKTFFLGALFTIPAGLLEVALSSITGIEMDGNLFQGFIGAFFFVAPIEEYAKYLAIRVKAYRSDEMNEVMDGIVYGVAAAMGFATLENIGYVFQHGIATGILRAFLSVPGHGIEGAIIGYYMAIGKMYPKFKKKYILKGLAIAIFFHGAFDFFAFSESALALMIVPLVFFMYLTFRKRIRLALLDSPFRNGRDEEKLSDGSAKITKKGIAKIIIGIALISFSALVILGSIISISEGDWSTGDTGYLIFLSLVPTGIGVLLIFLSKKDRTKVQAPPKKLEMT
jgi:protease PrsW